jgi:hypothetical protein
LVSPLWQMLCCHEHDSPSLLGRILCRRSLFSWWILCHRGFTSYVGSLALMFLNLHVQLVRVVVDGPLLTTVLAVLLSFRFLTTSSVVL